MNIRKKTISITELGTQISKRFSGDYNSSDIIISDKIITEEFIMQDRIINPNYGPHPASVKFIDCEFQDNVKIGNYDNAGYIIFNNCFFKKDVECFLDNTTICNNIFENNLRLLVHRTRSNEFTIEYIQILGKLILSGSISSLTIREINNNVGYINNGSLEIFGEIEKIKLLNFAIKDLKLSANSNEYCEFKKIKVTDNLWIKSKFDGDLKIIDSNINIIEISKLQGLTKEVAIINTTITSFVHPIGNSNKLLLNNCTIELLKLENANDNNSIINIQETTFENLLFENMLNSGSISLRELNISSKGLIAFKSSNMGKTDFINCDFSKASLEFQNSKISEAFFSETEFPSRVVVNGKVNYPQAQLTFGQLALAFQKQGDNIRALEFGAREVEAHYKSIRWNRKHFITTLNLFFNYVSNNFGRNWVQGVLFSISVGLIFFSLLLITTDQFQFGFPSFSYELLPTYLKFMNPLRFYELELLFKNSPYEKIITLNPSSYLIDFLGRVFIAYGYYQTIQAFRRYGRK